MMLKISKEEKTEFNLFLFTYESIYIKYALKMDDAKAVTTK